MILRCPVCRAENESVSTCRRCKADLTPLVELEQRRADFLRRAMRAVEVGDGEAALRYARQACYLRPGPDALRWLAVAHLIRRDFRRALSCHRLATAP